jgi:hypothetical protein
LLNIVTRILFDFTFSSGTLTSDSDSEETKKSLIVHLTTEWTTLVKLCSAGSIIEMISHMAVRERKKRSFPMEVEVVFDLLFMRFEEAGKTEN